MEEPVKIGEGSSVKACVVHAARDVRIEHRDTGSAGAGEVMVGFAWGGICGSDIHYFEHGRVGDSIVRNPMILGHEFSGTVIATGEGVTGLVPGDKVAVNPASPCGHCSYCKSGDTNLCTDMQFMGSAARQPHRDGGFSEVVRVKATQCVKAPADADLQHLAMAEPFAVALHAVAMAGDVSGRTVLVTGAGVIGQMVAVAARRAGAQRIIMSDVSPQACERAVQLGIDEVVNATDASGVSALTSAPRCDIALEASGAPQALDLAIEAMKPRGRLVQVGFLPPTAPLHLAKLLTREHTITGTYRFSDEFETAVHAITTGEVDLRPMISAELPLDAPEAVFERALDKARTLKVMVAFQ